MQKRDFDLIRKLLIHFEQSETIPPRQSYSLNIDGYDRKSVAYHLKIMEDAALIEIDEPDRHWVIDAGEMMVRTTWNGQEYLAAVRDETIYAKTKKTILESTGSLTFELIKAFATKLMRSQPGL